MSTKKTSDVTGIIDQQEEKQIKETGLIIYARKQFVTNIVWMVNIPILSSFVDFIVSTFKKQKRIGSSMSF